MMQSQRVRGQAHWRTARRDGGGSSRFTMRFSLFRMLNSEVLFPWHLYFAYIHLTCHLCHDAVMFKMTHESFICVSWLIHVLYDSFICCITYIVFMLNVSHDSFIRVVWLIHAWCVSWLIHMCCMTHSCVLFVRLIHMCCMTHSCVVPFIHMSLISGSYICADTMIWVYQLDKKLR